MSLTCESLISGWETKLLCIIYTREIEFTGEIQGRKVSKGDKQEVWKGNIKTWQEARAFGNGDALGKIPGIGVAHRI